MTIVLTLSFLLDFVTNGIIANCWIAIFLREDFSLSEAAQAFGFMCLSTANFELPTGFLADRFLGRKGSVLVGMLLIGIGMLVLSMTERFPLSATEEDPAFWTSDLIKPLWHIMSDQGQKAGPHQDSNSSAGVICPRIMKIFLRTSAEKNSR